jgi:predicted phosphodiesterase
MARAGRHVRAVHVGWACLVAAPSLFGATLTRGPYLGRPGDTSVAVVWDTDQPAPSKVEYGLQGVPPASLGSEVLTTHHVVAIGGLQSGAVYQYQVFSGDTPLAAMATFIAPRDATETAFAFAVIGDTATASPEEAAVTDRIADQLAASGVDLVLHAGDVVYPSGQRSSYDTQFFLPFADLLVSTPMLPALGNHDIRSAAGAPLLTSFVVPANGVTAQSRFYSLRQADAIFVCLDVESSSYGAGSAQYAWLVHQLASSAAKWKFVFFHEPPYSASNSNRLVRLILCPLFEKYGVDVVFSGHEHLYERTWPIHDFITTARGVVYVTEGGGGGSPLSTFKANSDTAFVAARHGYAEVQVDGDTLLLQAHDPGGVVFDAVVIEKPASGQAARLARAQRHIGPR